MQHAQRSRRAVPFGVAAFVAVCLMVSTTTALADAPGQQVTLGTPVGLTGSGFSANEALSAWAIGPDGGVLPITGVKADGSGTFSTTVSFPTTGQWQVTVHSTGSGKDFTGLYTVASGGSSTPLTIPPLTNGASAPQVAIGAPVTVTGSGFAANESVSLWETAPGGTVAPISTVQADANGAFSTVVTFASSGQWLVTARGAISGKSVIGAYDVGPGPAATSATAVTQFSPLGSSAPLVVLGAPSTLTVNGFTVGETVSVWETGPDASVTPLSSAHADEDGSFSTVVSFPTAGYWQVTAQGRTSAHVVVTAFNVTNGSTAPTATTSAAPAPTTPTATPGVAAPYTRAVAKVTMGSVVNFSAAGFNASEPVDAWTTSPDGSVTPLDTAQASTVGQITVSTSFPAAGLWGLTLRGRLSGHEVVGNYQVASAT